MVQIIVETLEERRLLSFGSLVTGFGNAGHVDTNLLAPAGAPIVKDLQVSGGKILVGGGSGLVRYLADGSADPSFGNHGVAPLDGIAFTGLAADAARHVYVLGQTKTRTVLERYLPDGTLDASYRSAGAATVTTSKTFSPEALAVQADDKVLVAGIVKNSSTGLTTTRIYRLQADGSPDLSWGQGAVVNLQLGETSLLAPNLVDNVAGIVAEPDGTVLVGGDSISYFAGGFDPIAGELKPFAYGDAMFVVARLNADGGGDTSYATGGIRRSIYASGIKSNIVTAFAVGGDGTAGLATSDAASRRVIFASFSPDGMLEVNKTADAGYELGDPLDMAAGSDGRFFVLGENPRRGNGLQLAAVTSAGVFSNVAYTEDPADHAASIVGRIGQIAIGADGDLIVAGQPATPGYALAKYDAGNPAAAPADQLTNGRSNSIYRDAAGGLHVAYFDAAKRVLMYDHRAPDGIWDAPVIVDATENAGQYISIAADSDGNPGIAYFDGTHGDLKFAWRKNDVWHTEAVDSRGSVGLYPSLLFSRYGPAVAYFDKTHGDLKFAVRNTSTGEWGFEYVQRTGIVGRSGSLTINPGTGGFEVAYVDSGNGLVNWAHHLPHGRWAHTTAAATAGGADFLSLAYIGYREKEPSIAFYNAGPANLELTTFSGTSWTTRTLLSKGAVGLYNTLVSDTDGASIYTYDRTHDQALLVRDDSSGISAESIIGDGGRYLSVFSEGSIADMIYFDSADAVLKVRGAPITIS